MRISNNIAFAMPQLLRQIKVGELVKRIRTRLHLTQEQLAREIGVSFSTVNQWENDRRCPQPYLRRRLQELDATSTSDDAARSKAKAVPRRSGSVGSL